MSRLERQLLAYSNRSKEARDAEVRLGLFAWEPGTKSMFAFKGRLHTSDRRLFIRALANGLAGNWWPVQSLTKLIGDHGVKLMGNMTRLNSTMAASAPLVTQPLLYWEAPDRTNSDSMMMCPVGHAKGPWLSSLVWHMLLDDYHRDGQLCRLAWESSQAFAELVLLTVMRPRAPSKETFDMQAGLARKRIVDTLQDPRRFVRDKDRLVPLDPALYFTTKRIVPTSPIERQWMQTAIQFGPKAAADVWALKWATDLLWDNERSIVDQTYRHSTKKEKSNE